MALISWNCRGFLNKKYEIHSIITDHNPICLALQETHLKPSNLAKLRGYTCIRKDKLTDGRAKGGVALFISRDHPYTSIPLHTNLQAVAVQMHIQHLITFCNIYLPPNETLNQNDLDDLLQQLPNPYIITGDFNAHSSLWGNQNTNFRGQIVENLISANNLSILNNGEKTHFHEPTKTFHATDLSLCAPILFPFWNFTVSSDLHDSDHFPVYLKPVGQNINLCKRNQRYIYLKADWQTYQRLANITQEMIQGDINNVVHNITHTILHAADISIPKTSPYFRPSRHKPWWNNLCQEAKKKKNKAWNIFRRYPCNEKFILFKKARAEARKVYRKSQQESWKNYTSTITYNTSSKHLWKKVKSIMGVYTEQKYSFLIKNGQTITSKKTIADTIGETLAEISSSESYTEPFLSYKRHTEHRKLNFNSKKIYPYNYPFTEAELNNVLKKPHNSSPGQDGITYIMIRNLCYNSLQNLLALYNRIWSEHLFPSVWCTSIIIPFPKPGKNATDPKNYRPIALSSCICKIFEKMVNNRLVHLLETNHNLNCLPEWL